MKQSLVRIFVLDIPAVLLLLAFSYYLTTRAQENGILISLITEYGYLAALLMGIVGGANMFVPVAPIVFLPLFLEAGLSQFAVVLILSIGITVGDITGYIIGRAGRTLARETKKNRATELLERYRERPYLIYAGLFLYAAFLPLPNEFLTIPLAFFGFRLHALLLPLLSGNFIFNTLAGYGIINLFKLLP